MSCLSPCPYWPYPIIPSSHLPIFTPSFIPSPLVSHVATHLNKGMIDPPAGSLGHACAYLCMLVQTPDRLRAGSCSCLMHAIDRVPQSLVWHFRCLRMPTSWRVSVYRYRLFDWILNARMQHYEITGSDNIDRLSGWFGYRLEIHEIRMMKTKTKTKTKTKK